jgi:hypothetical protein
MDKAKITSLAAMSEEKVKDDISMTPLERLTLAFQISDFAIELHQNHEIVEEETSSIRWIELNQISS